MADLIKIAVDAMGGDNSPKKIVDGILHNHNQMNNDNFYKIFGDKEMILSFINKKIDEKFYEIIDTKDQVRSTDTALEAAKRGKKTSMWLAIESVKKKRSRYCYFSW